MSVRPHMALLWSLADRVARMAIDMALLRELVASPPRPLGSAGETFHLGELMAGGRPSSDRSVMFIVTTALRRRAKLHRSGSDERSAHMALLRSLADRGERMAINMTLLRSLADHGARRAINMALLMELAASPPRPSAAQEMR